MEGNELNFDNILSEQEIDTLFESPEETVKEDKDPKENEENGGKPESKDSDNERNDTAETVSPEALFGDNEGEEKQPESVGSEKTEGKEDTSTDDNSGASPNQNFYSSIANAMAVDGIFPNLTDDDISKATDAESFSNLVEAEINARLDEKQQRVLKALDNGVEPTDIRKYENTINYVNSITDAQLSEEGERGEQIRRSLIYQDFLNKGYTPEKAQKYTDRTIDAGTDIEDAKDALQSNREYFTNAYNSLLKEAEKTAEKEKAERAKEAEKLKDSMMNDKQLLGDMDIDKSVRRNAFEAITKPVYKDPETGDYFTAVQKYEREHKAEFLKYVGLMYTLTDGFKDFDSFAKGKVKKEVRKGLRELEQALNNSKRDSGGNIRMVTNAKDDPESYLNNNWTIAL